MSKLDTSVTAAATLASLGVTANGTIQIVSTDIDGNSSTSTVAYTTGDTISDVMDSINNVTTNRAMASLRGLGGEGTPLLNIENVGNGSITITETGTGDFLSKLGMEKIGNPRPDADYYLGDHQIMELRVDEQYDVSYGILAENPAFQQLIQGLGIAASTENQDALSTALALSMMPSMIFPTFRGKSVLILPTSNVLKNAIRTLRFLRPRRSATLKPSMCHLRLRN